MQVNVEMSESGPLIPKTVPKEMISVGESDGKTLVRINSSSLAVIQECLRKAKYLLRDKMTAEMEAPATVFGSAIHAALEVFYTGAPLARKLPKLEQLELMSYGHAAEGEGEDLILRAVRAFINRAEPLAQLPAENKRSIQNGVYILWHYFKAYLDDPYVALVDDTGAFVERAFSFRLYENNLLAIDYFGTIDLVVKHIQTGEIMVCDHKTSSVVGADFYNRLKPNHQYTGYLYGARQAFGLKTNMFMVNCLEVKAKPKTVRGTPPSFPRQITTRDDGDYTEFRDAVVSAVESYLYQMKAGAWPLGHVNTCATYGGCSYLSVCSAPRSLRENILNAKFKKGDPNELK